MNSIQNYVLESLFERNQITNLPSLHVKLMYLNYLTVLTN